MLSPSTATRYRSLQLCTCMTATFATPLPRCWYQPFLNFLAHELVAHQRRQQCVPRDQYFPLTYHAHKQAAVEALSVLLQLQTPDTDSSSISSMSRVCRTWQAAVQLLQAVQQGGWSSLNIAYSQQPLESMRSLLNADGA